MSNTVIDLSEVTNVGKPPAQVLWYRAMSKWIDGEPVKKSKGSLRLAGDTIHHNTGGEIQGLRTAGLIMYRASGLSEHYNPTHLQVSHDISGLAYGTICIRGAYHWNQDPALRRSDEDTTWTWDIPRNLNRCTPVPGILLTLSTIRPMTADLVDMGTRLEHDRVQRIIKSRSKSKVGWLTNNLMDDSDFCSRTRQVTFKTMNTLRGLFGVDPLPEYESPIAGLALADYKNLHALAC
jgi:hypothetical protein